MHKNFEEKCPKESGKAMISAFPQFLSFPEFYCLFVDLQRISFTNINLPNALCTALTGECGVSDHFCTKNNGHFLDFPVYLWKPVAEGSFFFGTRDWKPGIPNTCFWGGRCTRFSKKTALKGAQNRAT